MAKAETAVSKLQGPLCNEWAQTRQSTDAGLCFGLVIIRGRLLG
jgi:hypothetical protein